MSLFHPWTVFCYPLTNICSSCDPLQGSAPSMPSTEVLWNEDYLACSTCLCSVSYSTAPGGVSFPRGRLRGFLWSNITGIPLCSVDQERRGIRLHNQMREDVWDTPNLSKAGSSGKIHQCAASCQRVLTVLQAEKFAGRASPRLLCLFTLPAPFADSRDSCHGPLKSYEEKTT